MKSSELAGREILIIDDATLFARQLQAYLRNGGASAVTVSTLADGKKELLAKDFDFVLLDLSLPDGNGLSLLRDRLLPPTTGVIVVTSDGQAQTAVEAMQLGAGDYLVKPFDFSELPLVFTRCREAVQRGRATEYEQARETVGDESFFFGESLGPLHDGLQKILAADRRMQGSLPPVLIHGETGTGKSSIARWIHHQGPRARGPLVEVNCATLPEALAESELFGHERGAFTDARQARIGLFEAAVGGTLFLDEIASLSAPVQAKVLTAIEDGRIRRVGGNRSLDVDARIIAASIHDLNERVAAGAFREDLLHRLDLLRVRIPPLRERGADIAELAEHLLRGLGRRYGRPSVRLSPEAASRLRSHPWPGNVRELSHELERSLVLEEGSTLRLDAIAARPAHGQHESPPPNNSDWLNPAWAPPKQGFSLEKAINRLIHVALEDTGGNVSAAARVLGVPRDYVRYRLSKEDGDA